MFKLLRKWVGISVIILVIILFSNATDVNASDKALTDNDRTGAKSLRNCIQISANLTNDGKIKVKITPSGRCSFFKWKAYIKAPNSKDDFDDYFTKEGMIKDNIFGSLMTEDNFNVASKAGKEITINSKEEYVQVFVQPLNEQTHCFNEITDKNGKKICTEEVKIAPIKKIRRNGSNMKFVDPAPEGYGRIVFDYGKTFFKPAEIENPVYYRAECDAMRQGDYYSSAEDGSLTTKEKKIQDKVQSNLADFKEKIGRYFPYCLVENGYDFEFSEKFIREIRKAFMEYYSEAKDFEDIIINPKMSMEHYNSIIANYTVNYPKNLHYKPTVKGTTDNDYSTSIGEISCDVNARQSKTQVYWTDATILSNGLCTVKCAEKLTTTYSPPIFSRAGLCFTYKVTVKSKVDCGVQKDNGNLWPDNNYNSCRFSAMCDRRTTQAGPNNAFENCVKECDGGKYTQKCLNSCYNKVYNVNNSNVQNNKKSNTKVLNNVNNINEAKLELLANSNTAAAKAAKNNYKIVKNARKKRQYRKNIDNKYNPYHIYYDSNNNPHNLSDECGTYDNVLKNIDICVEGFMYAKSQLPLGYYHLREDGKYEWNNNTKNNKTVKDPYGNIVHDDSIVTKQKEIGAGKYGGYVRTDVKDNQGIVRSMERVAPFYLSSKDEARATILSLYAADRSHDKYNKGYEIDENGIKRQMRPGYTCPEECWFYKIGEGAKCYTASEVEDEYNNKEDELSRKKDLLEQCVNAAKGMCSTKTSTFYISAKDNTERTNLKCDETGAKKTQEQAVWGKTNNSICSYMGTNNSKTSESERKNCSDGDNKIFETIKDNKEDKINGLDAINQNISRPEDKYPLYQDKEMTGGTVICPPNGINGICYGIGQVSANESYSESHQYKTTISFPGMYLNKKSGEITQKEEDGSEEKENNVCSTFDTKNTNVEWWKSRERQETTYNGNIPDWNIKAKISNFGKFGWTYNTQCFYAIFNHSCDDECCGENCPKTVLNNTVRTVDATDVFNKKTNKNREVGFNWTDDAKIPEGFDKVLAANGYAVTKENDSAKPTKYLEKIQTTAADGKTYDDSEIDFHVQIAPANDKRNGYLTIDQINKYSSFTSKFIEDKQKSCSGKDISGYFEPFGEGYGNDKSENKHLVFSVYHSCILSKLGVQTDKSKTGTRQNNYK